MKYSSHKKRLSSLSSTMHVLFSSDWGHCYAAAYTHMEPPMNTRVTGLSSLARSGLGPSSVASMPVTSLFGV
ncbi:hypothetical protein EYF80_055461 [Liparis tanakae]|uniref:Uncharacterized protein n=1 Tax=Liparis tanakae TaxID=230148 RepID=A0A4Z2EZI1_9TELE|nr:hypothetical protein EYF80_055461 [Liparis tanakae]